MITKLTNLIGNKKVIWGIILFTVILIISHSLFFSPTKKNFDTDGDGKIDRIEYYQKGIKVKEVIYFGKIYPSGKRYIYWNKEGSINKIIDMYLDSNYSLFKTVRSYNKGEKINSLGLTFIKQELVGSKNFNKKRKLVVTQLLGRYYIYSKDRRISFAEIETNKGMINKVILFDQNGRTAQTKEDKDSNGKFEYYEFYEHGKKTAVGYDYDEDGEIDKKEEAKNKSR